MRRLLSIILLLAIAGFAAQHTHQDIQNRGNQGMGFDQDKTTHHFLLTKDGGIIQVQARSAGDKESVAEVRMHLNHIQHAFSAGDFDIPMFVHEQTPPGVPTMKKLKDQIRYSYEELEDGGRVVINSKNAEAVNAVHQFLKFQIREHKTGDPVDAK